MLKGRLMLRSVVVVEVVADNIMGIKSRRKYDGMLL